MLYLNYSFNTRGLVDFLSNNLLLYRIPQPTKSSQTSCTRNFKFLVPGRGLVLLHHVTGPFNHVSLHFPTLTDTSHCRQPKSSLIYLRLYIFIASGERNHLQADNNDNLSRASPRRSILLLHLSVFPFIKWREDTVRNRTIYFPVIATRMT